MKCSSRSSSLKNSEIRIKSTMIWPTNYSTSTWRRERKSLCFLSFSETMARFVHFSVWVLFLLAVECLQQLNSEPTEEKQALLDFISKTHHQNRLQWNISASFCTWAGVHCDDTQSFVYSLRLPGVGLVGQIPAMTIGRLKQLRILSLRSNRLSGELPSDFSELKLLRSIYLQNNAFSGEFPNSLTELSRLTLLDISSNNFTGEIPLSVNNLTHLSGFFLENNGFSGNLHSIHIQGLESFNVSNNKLNGSIPANLLQFPSSSFSGNQDLCGGPLNPCQSIFPSSSPSNFLQKLVHRKSKKLSKSAIIAISVCSIIICLLLIFIVCCRRRKQPAKLPPNPAITTTEAGGLAEPDKNKLRFVDDGIYSFDLDDLLRASAEILGKGNVGTSYKAVLEEGTTVVVKRLKDVSVTKKEFEVQMGMLGKLKHENLLPIRAFYYSKDEKLLVHDFMPAGSLSALLHGRNGSGRIPLNWDNRLKIAVSVGRGLAHLHVSGKTVHGNIKASNILLRSDLNAYISDFGLNPLTVTSNPPNKVSGYCAPEVTETRKLTLKSDVYSYGVLLLELLTGKAPNQVSVGEKALDLPRWVQLVLREEWTAEVFDVKMIRYNNNEEEMVMVLQIAMACVSVVPDQRPGIEEVLRMIDIQWRDLDNLICD